MLSCVPKPLKTRNAGTYGLEDGLENSLCLSVLERLLLATLIVNQANVSYAKIPCCYKLSAVSVVSPWLFQMPDLSPCASAMRK